MVKVFPDVRMALSFLEHVFIYIVTEPAENQLPVTLCLESQAVTTLTPSEVGIWKPGERKAQVPLKVIVLLSVREEILLHAKDQLSGSVVNTASIGRPVTSKSRV